MNYAVVQIGGKQFKVSEGTIIKLERQENPVFDVLLVKDDANLYIGQPSLQDFSVTATVLEHKFDAKIRVARYKAKSRYRKVKGHKQPITVLKIDKIEKSATASKKSTKKESK